MVIYLKISFHTTLLSIEFEGNTVIASKPKFRCFILTFLFCLSFCNPLYLSLLFRRNRFYFFPSQHHPDEPCYFNNLQTDIKGGRLLSLIFLPASCKAVSIILVIRRVINNIKMKKRLSEKDLEMWVLPVVYEPSSD